MGAPAEGGLGPLKTNHNVMTCSLSLIVCLSSLVTFDEQCEAICVLKACAPEVWLLMTTGPWLNWFETTNTNSLTRFFSGEQGSPPFTQHEVWFLSL